MLEILLIPFSVHNHTNVVQLHQFKCSKDNLVDGKVLISKNFSENYALKKQDEIMSGHWSEDQLSLFCATAHFLENGKHVFQHFPVLCSDDVGQQVQQVQQGHLT